MRIGRGILWAAVATAGCAEGMDEATPVESGEPTFVWHDDGGDEDFVDKSVCSGRWVPPAQVIATGVRQDVRYDGPGSRCSGGPTDGAEVLGDAIRDRFASLMNLGVPGRGVQIYACRNVNGGSGMSVHAAGRAIDVFVPTRSGGAADNARGDQIAAWLVANAEAIGVQSIIWDRTIWTFNGGEPRCYTGRHPHNDHVHVELNTDAARMRTPFFRGGEVEPDPVDPSPPASAAWIGDPCRADADCAFSHGGVRGACALDHRPASGAGFCTLACAGFCPDKSGRATTFCAEADALGGFAGGGQCAARSDSENDRCRRYPGFVELEVSRYVGRSSASPARATVCAPEEVLGVVDPGPAEPPPDAGNDLCDDRELPMSEHGYGCGGVVENTWRCACSTRLGTSVSQVCREGIWLNFQTDPRDCARCSGRYSSACNR